MFSSSYFGCSTYIFENNIYGVILPGYGTSKKAAGRKFMQIRRKHEASNHVDW